MYTDHKPTLTQLRLRLSAPFSCDAKLHLIGIGLFRAPPSGQPPFQAPDRHLGWREMQSISGLTWLLATFYILCLFSRAVR